MAYRRDRQMKFTVNMSLIVDEEENILPVNYDNKESDEQSLKDILTDYFFDIDGIKLEGVKIKKHE